MSLQLQICSHLLKKSFMENCIFCLLWSIAFLLMELTAFSAASGPASWHAHTCKAPAEFLWTLSAIHITFFPRIWRNTSPNPVNCNPGFLFNSIKRLAVNASKCSSKPEFESGIFVMHKLFTKPTKNFEDLNSLQEFLV